jgi:hypothetical protein
VEVAADEEAPEVVEGEQEGVKELVDERTPGEAETEAME